MTDKVLITTAIDYANDVIHIGHAYQKVLADVFARFYRLDGKKVFFVTGTDEHGGNIEKIAHEKQMAVADYVNQISEADKKEIDVLDVSYDRFIKTTDEDHKATATEFWKKISSKGEIYLKSFEGKYCLSCEAFKSPSEMVDGHCDIHKTKELVDHKEENYFFKWSNYQKFLLDFFEQNKDFVLPENRYKEMYNFLSAGLEDISISRQGIKWGVPVPSDPDQVMYVWFDALINYYTAGQKTGFWDNDTTIIHFIGKDNLRWHALLWPAMLQAADLKLPNTVFAHDFINIDGNKVSKTLGNIIRPSELTDEFGSEAIRYFFLKRGPLYNDVDISKDKIKEVYHADLANGLGNLVQRLSKIANSAAYVNKNKAVGFSQVIKDNFKLFKIGDCVQNIQERIDQENRFINDVTLWKKEGQELKNDLDRCFINLSQIVYDLQPFMPKTAKEINSRIADEVQFGEPLFKRIT